MCNFPLIFSAVEIRKRQQFLFEAYKNRGASIAMIIITALIIFKIIYILHSSSYTPSRFTSSLDDKPLNSLRGIPFNQLRTFNI